MGEESTQDAVEEREPRQPDHSELIMQCVPYYSTKSKPGTVHGHYPTVGPGNLRVDRRPPKGEEHRAAVIVCLARPAGNPLVSLWHMLTEWP